LDEELGNLMHGVDTVTEFIEKEIQKAEEEKAKE